MTVQIRLPGVFVDAANHGFEDGSRQAPYNTVTEGIEAVDRRFCLGVQWHPEFAIDPADEKIFRALIAAASR